MGMKEMMERLGMIFGVKGNSQARSTTKERKKRKTRRKIATASRRKNRKK